MRKLRNFFGGRLFPCALLAVLCAAVLCVAAIWLPRALAPIAVAERLFSLAVALALAVSRDTPDCKISKLILPVLLPWVGAFLCILWRRRTPPPRTAPLRAQTGLLSRIAAISRRPVLYAGEAEYFPLGSEMSARLIQDLSEAKKFIWLEYYIVARGNFFGRLLPILREKAKAGLDVRLAYDGFGCSLTLPRAFPNEMKRAGVKTTVIRPVRFPLHDLNRRNHRKIAAIDGVIAYTGGINLSDEYTGEKIRFGHWKDTAIRVTGEPARALAELFADDVQIPMPEVPCEKGGVPCAIVSDGAKDTERRAGESAIGLLLSSAERYAYCNTPYLAPSEALLTELKRAADCGTDVRVLIPHIPDKRTTFLLTRRYARELLRAGVRIREYRAGFLHAKSVVTDGTHAFVSSYNLDYRSLYLQAECGVAVQDEEIAERLKQDFLTAWEESVPVPPAKFFERVCGAILRLFAPLM